MVCRSCGQEERASEGYPCKDCGTFICIMCVFKGVIRCERCAASSSPAGDPPLVSGRIVGTGQPPATSTELDWPEH
jgi:hypothetical protein